MFENKYESLAPRNIFVMRIVFSGLIALAVIAISLAVGTVGYRVFGGLTWVDALLNAAMILTGMGPVDQMKTVGGKLFATLYCLFSGIVFLTLMAIILAPIYHRFLHSFNLPDEDDADDKSKSN